MFLVSVIPILVRVSEYAYIFCSVKIKMNSRIIGIHLASPPLTVTCTLTACYSFTAMSTGTSSNVTGLLFCSQTEALVLVFFFSYLNQQKKTFLFVLFVVLANFKGEHAPVPFSHICMQTLFECYIRQFSSFVRKETKSLFFTTLSTIKETGMFLSTIAGTSQIQFFPSLQYLALKHMQQYQQDEENV